MISHHCSVCGEQVDEFCDAHPTATVDSILVSAENAAMIAYWYAKERYWHAKERYEEAKANDANELAEEERR